ncbi:Rgg/GadR/MutR family transcriptional regulator [Lactobacillus sp. ESL0791]|uniref:helix-turn-helix domain-containing protein n=1 Tax=Lactobacillus sp. ESL0791 TaxID=2983234 RepID=UPI0023F836A6|nr:Rgg/GadR/MutR family transcriptional regulator [Lactobacillus sp. ESL0791]MDF7639875.1 Rgg/GadR/MutR family transcriptional regulator [Lactobacillus sp. ESL0791]
MSIGQLLKKYRIEQVKTQKEWSENVISPSFYSKVEKDLNHISAHDLIALLRKNKVPLVKFFDELDTDSESQQEQTDEIDNIIIHAFYHNSTKELQQLQQVIAASDLPDKADLLLTIRAFIASIMHKDLSTADKTALREKIFNIPELDKTKLELYCNFFTLYDLDDNLKLVKKIVQKFQDSTDVSIQELLLGIICNLLANCIEAKRDKEAQFFIKSANEITTRPELFFYKNALLLMANLIAYHLDGQKEHLANCQLALKNFTVLGMPEYGQTLTQFYETYK